MKDKLLIVFRGWSSTKGLYREIEKIYEGWDVLYSEDLIGDEGKRYKRVAVVAWSMGTLDAIEYIDRNHVDEIILLSPTLDFTSTTRPVIVKRMMKRIKTDMEGCLRDFSLLCFSDKRRAIGYWKEYRDEMMEIPEEILTEGLDKLLNKRVEAGVSQKKALIVMGRMDEIISIDNSMEAAKLYPAADIRIIEGGHNLLYERIDELLQEIKEYRRKICHT